MNDDPSVGFNVQGHSRPERPFYHPLRHKKWLQCGVDNDDYGDDDYDVDDRDTPTSEGLFRQAMMQDTIAFIGNSVAFCMGCGDPIDDATGRWWDRSRDKIMMNTLTIPFEVRSTRGVLTQGEVFRAIQSTVWLNNGFAVSPAGDLYFEGIRAVVRDYRETSRDDRDAKHYKDDCPTLAEVARWGQRLAGLSGAPC